MATAVDESVGSQEIISHIAKTAQKVKAVAQECNMQKTIVKELLDTEKQFDKSAKIFSGQGKPTPPKTADAKKASELIKTECLVEKNGKKIDLSYGRVRYYEKVQSSDTPGPTSGRSFVTEFDPKTNRVRQWNECYDHAGNVNRVRPKHINGRTVESQHYPATYTDIQKNLKGSQWVIPKKNLH